MYYIIFGEIFVQLNISMVQISKEIEKLEAEQLDIQLQARLAKILKQMKSLDSSSEKYNKLVKEVLNLQIQQLELEKKQLKESKTFIGKLSNQNDIRRLENQNKDVFESIVNQKLDPDINKKLKSAADATTKDIEKTFEKVVDKFSTEIENLGKASVNMSKNDIVRIGKKAKQQRQEQMYYTQNNTDEKTSASEIRKKIAEAETSEITSKKEKLIAKELKDAIFEVKEDIEKSDTKAFLDIQNRKLEILTKVFETNQTTFESNISSELTEIFADAIKKSKQQTSIIDKESKFTELRKKSSELDLYDKISSAGDKVASTFGKLDPVLGEFAETMISGISGIYKFAEAIDDIPKTIKSVSNIFGSLASVFTKDKKLPSVIDNIEGEESIDRLQTSIDELGGKIISLHSDKTRAGIIDTPEKLKIEERKKESLLSRISTNSGNTDNVIDIKDRLKKPSNIDSKESKIRQRLTSVLSTQIEATKNVVSSISDQLPFISRLTMGFKSLIVGVIALNRTMITTAFANIGTTLTSLIPLKVIRAFRFITTGLLGAGRAIVGLFKFMIPAVLAIGTGITKLAPLLLVLIVPIVKIIALIGAFALALGGVIAILSQIASWAGLGPKQIPSRSSGSQPGQSGSTSNTSATGANAGTGALIGMDAAKNAGLTNRQKNNRLLNTPDSLLTPGERKQKERQQNRSYLRSNSRYLGQVTAMSESGNDGSRIGKEATGHNSYGIWQIHHNNMMDFMETLPEERRNELMRAGPIGSKEFNDKWREIGNESDMRDSQRQYIKSTHYDKLANSLRMGGKDLSGKGKGVQELIFSTAVQEGPGTKTIHEALKDKDIDSMSDAEIINAISDFKKQNVYSKFPTHIAKHGSADLLERIEKEKQTTLALDNQRMKEAKYENKELQTAKSNRELKGIVAGDMDKMKYPPAPVVINQGGKEEFDRGGFPIDLRNLESTFIRNLDRDYALIR